MYKQRIKYYQQLEDLRKSKVIVYVTSDRQGMQTMIQPDVIDYLAEHLDAIYRKSNKISLILYSRGGVTLAAWNIVNLIRMFCDNFEVIIPSVAHSAATLISIGADKIVMTKQATLGPIDPSVNTPLNPIIPYTNMPVPVSVEDVNGFFNLAKKELGDDSNLMGIMQQLAQNVHPLALGAVARSREQIKMLAERLLTNHMEDKKKRKKVIDFLCSESGSHDYTINRREAEKDLNLPIEKPDDELYSLIRSIYTDIRSDLSLRQPFNQALMVASASDNAPVPYKCKMALLESIDGGSDQYTRTGNVIKVTNAMQMVQGQAIQVPVPQIFDQATSEGWIHVGPKDKES